MQSGQVNASQLLAAFLGGAKEKLGQKITKNDFSGELEKHLSKQVKVAGASNLEGHGAGKTDDSNADSNGSATDSDARTDTAGVKIKEIKSKARAEKNLLVSNPAILESVLANLHYPAQARDECQTLLGKQGGISIQDLNSILDTRPDTASGAAEQVPASSVRALVESIVKASGSAAGKGAGGANSFKSSVATKQEGSYTRDELRNLLEKVVQASQKADSQAQPSSLSSTTSTDAQTETVESLKTGQTEELVSTVLPSFATAGGKVSSARVLAAAAVSKALGSQNADGKAAELREGLVQAGSTQSNSPGGAGAEGSGSSSGDGEQISTGMGVIMRTGENGASQAPAQGEGTDTASAGLDVAAELADLIKAGGFSEQTDSGASQTTTGAYSLKDVETRAELGGQDTPMLGKQIEKFVGGKDQPSEDGVLQTTEFNPDDNLINLQQMNNSGGDDFSSYDRNRQGELVQEARGGATTEAPATNPGDDGIAAILDSYISAGDEIGSMTGILTGGLDDLKSGAQSLSKIDSARGPVQDVSNIWKSGEQTASDKAAQAGDGATGGSVGAGSAGAGNWSSTASASAWSLAQQEAVSLPSGVIDQDVQSSDGQSLGSSFQQDATGSIAATTMTQTLAAIEQSVFGTQGVAVDAKRIDEPAAGTDTSTGLALLQASPSNPQAINMQPADNSAQNGSAMYDPYRAVELANSVIEQMGSGSGRQLVLEMDSDGLGKINLKVGARKDEISVEALTQNEPARQALMSHSIGLRQDLRNQGLVLGKFMVDVNGGKAGGGNSADANQSGGKGGGTPKETKARAIKTLEPSIRAAAATGRSQISVFA